MTIPAFVIGCDPSSKKLAFFAAQPFTNTAVAQAYQLSRTKSSPYEPGNLIRARQASLDFLGIADIMAPSKSAKKLVIEKPLVGRGGAHATIVQSKVAGVVEECFAEHGYEVVVVNLQTWKSYFGIAGERTGAGGGKKTSGIKRALEAKGFAKDLAVCKEDSDLYDAAGICRWGQRKSA